MVKILNISLITIKYTKICNLKALIELRRIETAEDIATQLSQSPNVAYVSDSANMLLSAAGIAK
jgi:hypothetical protein